MSILRSLKELPDLFKEKGIELIDIPIDSPEEQQDEIVPDNLVYNSVEAESDTREYHNWYVENIILSNH